MLNKKQSKWLIALSTLLTMVGLFAVSGETVNAQDRGTRIDDLMVPISGSSDSNPFVIPRSLNNQTSNDYGVDVVTPDEHVYMDNHYTFVPTFNSNTELTTGGGSGWQTLNWFDSSANDQPANTKYRSIHLQENGNNNQKGNIWGRYSNVGVVDGQSVDLKITLNDWTPYYDRVSWASFRQDEIAFSSTGYESIDMTWEFLKSGTSTPIPVSGYFTFGDIDLNQGLRFDKNTANKIDAIVLDEEVRDIGSDLYMRNDDNKVHIYDIATQAEKNAGDDGEGEDTDYPDNSGNPRARFSMVYSNQSSLRFEWVTEYGRRATPRDREKDRNIAYDWDGGNYAIGSYMFYELDKPIPTLTPEPVKDGAIQPMDNKGAYTITHTVPQESPDFTYSQYYVTDEVEKGLSNPKFRRITDQNGIDRSSWFDVAEFEDFATATATPAAREHPDFYGNTYTFEVDVDIDFDYVNSVNGGSFDFKNEAINVSGNMSSQTDNVTPVPKEAVTVRHINEDNGDVLESTDKRLLANSDYSESASFHGKSYGTDGVLEVSDVEVNGDRQGAKESISGKVPDGDLEITFYYRSPFKINITHVDDDTGETIHQDINYDNNHYKDDDWSFTPGSDPGLPNGKDTFNANGQEYPYLPVNDSRSGTIDFQDGENTTTDNTDYNYDIEFRYTKANVDVAIDSVRILTEHESNGLPMTIDFDLLSIDEENWGDDPRWDTTDVRVQVLDQSNDGDIIYDNLHTARDLRDNTLSWTIPATDLLTDEIRNYEVKLISPDDKEVFVRPNEGSLATDGYVASEETVRVTSHDNDRTLDEEWVAMTERHMGESGITLHKEGLNATVDEPLAMPTGYGHGDIQPIETWTDLDTDYLPEVSGQVLADPVLADGEYDAEGDSHVIPMDAYRAEQIDSTHVATDFDFPQTYVTEGGQGDVVVTEDQPEGSVNGHKRLYIPIWIDELGEYSYVFESTDPVGQNHVTVEIEQVVDIQSYMFAHSDSPSLNDDALLLQPTRDGWFADLFSRDPFETRKEYMWQGSDFTYSGATVTGFSEEGVANYQSIPEGSARLEIPTENPETGETITKIGDEAFRGFEFIGDFIAPSVEEIGSYAFYDANFTGEFSAENLTTVGDYAFTYSQFKGTLNAEHLESVGRYSFYHSVFDGDLSFVDTIGTEAFYHSKLEE